MDKPKKTIMTSLNILQSALIALLIIGTSLSSWSQSSKVDSLKLIWENQELHDSTRLIAVHRMIVYDLLYTDLELTRQYANEMKTFADSIGHKNQQAKALCNIGSSYVVVGDYVNTEIAFNEYLDFAIQNDLEIHAANANFTLGDIKRISGNLEEAITYYEKAKFLYSKNNYIRGLANSLYSQAQLEEQIGNNVAALENFYAALEIYKAQDEVKNILLIMSKIGSLFTAQKDFDKGLEYFEQGLTIAKEANDILNSGNFLNEIGSLYADQKHFEKAYEYFNEAYLLTKDNVYEMINASSLANLGWMEMERGEFEQALSKFKTAISIFERQGNTINASNVYIKMADALLGLNQKSEAIKISELALENASKFGDPKDRRDAADIAYRSYKAIGSPKALTMFEMYSSIKDSMLNEKLVKDIMRKEFEYENKAQILEDSLLHEEELAVLEFKNDKQQNLLFFGLCGILGISLFSFFLFRILKKVRLQNELITKSVNEKDILLKEIHHRVKNNLQLVSSLLTLQSREIQDEKAIAAIEAGKSRVRSMALIHQDLYTQDNLKGIGVKKYIESLANELFSTYKIDNEKITLDLDVQDLNLDVDSIIPLGLIINELMTNALKYAFTKNENGILQVNVSEKDGQLILDVKDDGIGVDEEIFRKDNSFGNKLIFTLTEQLDGDMTINGENGTHVKIEFKDYKLAS